MAANGRDTTLGGLVDRRLAFVALRFVAYFALFDAIILWLQARGTMATLAEWTAVAAGTAIRLTGVPATVAGLKVFLPNRVLIVILDCTSVFYVAVYSALVLAYPVAWRQRLVGLIVGIPAILVLNLLRFALVARVSVSADAIFGFTHDYLFQVAMVLASALLFVLWLSWCRGHEA